MACARKKNINGKETENSKFLTEFFSENKRAQIETICMQLYVTPERLRKEAEEVIDEMGTNRRYPQ